MKDHFSCTLAGSAWWKPMLAFFILFLAVYIPLEFAIIKMADTGIGNEISTLLFMMVMIVLLVLLEAGISVILCRIAFPTIAVRNEHFKFNGDIAEFIKLNLKGILLSIVTAGFYFPWYSTRIIGYLASNSEYRGEKALFQGNPGKLLKYYLLALWLPIILWSIIFSSLVFITLLMQSKAPAEGMGYGLIAGIVYTSIFFIIVPFIYLSCKWYVDFKWKDVSITWKTEMWPATFFLMGQVFLTIITLGIYWPAFYLKAYRYFIGKTIVESGGKEISRLGFDGRISEGFALLWGQALLSIITAGIFLPWAYANCIRYFINGSYIEDTQGFISQ